MVIYCQIPLLSQSSFNRRYDARKRRLSYSILETTLGPSLGNEFDANFYAGNYLYADSLSAKFPAMPLVYKTRYFPPVSKCLQFWYYMGGVKNKELAVNLHQPGSKSRQLISLRGDQGTQWKMVAVKLELKKDGSPFYVCIDSSQRSRSIASHSDFA